MVSLADCVDLCSAVQTFCGISPVSALLIKTIKYHSGIELCVINKISNLI